MKSSRLRDVIKGKESAISFEEYRIRYASERFLLRLQASPYSDNFIIKGGFLLGAVFKIGDRSTKDLDTLLKGIHAEKSNMTTILNQILAIDLGDGLHFELRELVDSQQERIYEGFCAKIKMTFEDEQSVVYFDLDLGVGDIVTPDAVLSDIPLLFNEKKGEHVTLKLPTYPLETVIAEKTEIILNLGTNNTRMKDFYDIHLILNYSELPDKNRLYQAFQRTWAFRHPNQSIDEEQFLDWYFIIDEILENNKMETIAWKNYQKQRLYAKQLDFKKIVTQFKGYVQSLQKEWEKQ